MEEKGVPSIAIVSQRLLGHFLPALTLGNELAKHGYEIHMLTHTSHQEMVRERGLLFQNINWDKFPDEFITEMMLEIKEFFEKHRVDLLVCDSTLAGPAYISEMMNIPYVSFQTTVPWPDSLLPGKYLVNMRLRKNYRDKLNSIRRSFGLDDIQDEQRTRGDLAGLSKDLHLVMVFPELAGSEIEKMPSSGVFVGPCLSFFNKAKVTKPQGNTVVVCTSSMNRIEYRTIINNYVRAVLESLHVNPNYHIWVLNHEPEYEPPSGNIKWFNEYPTHSKYFPVSDIIVTHGGCGTLQAAIHYGVPMLIIPLGGDHDLLADRCKKLGIAEIISPNEISVQKIGKVIDGMISSSFYHENAKKLAKKVHQYNPVQVAAQQIINFLMR